MTQNTESQSAKLDTRVTAIESSLDKIGSAINGLSSKLDERSKPQWILMISGAGILITLLGVIGAAWKAPIDSIVARQERDLQIIEGAIVPRVEIDNLRSATSRERDDMKKRLDRIEDWMFSSAKDGGQ